MITRLALYMTLGLLLDALGHRWDTWGFWAMLGLFWAAEALTRRETHEQSFVQGINAYINMTAEQQQKIATMLKDDDND